jgi:hypothetical protein
VGLRTGLDGCRKSRLLQGFDSWTVYANEEYADLTGRAVKCECLLPLTCWDFRFESRQGHGCLSLLSVVSRRGLCGGPISRRAELELWCVVVCDLETSRMPALGSSSRRIVGVVMLDTVLYPGT